MAPDKGTSPRDGGVYNISQFGSKDMITRTDIYIILEEPDKTNVSQQQWLCEDSNGFFLFSGKQSGGRSQRYLSVGPSNALEQVSNASQAARFVARKDPVGGFEILVFVNGTTPALRPVDKVSGILKVVAKSDLRFDFTLLT
jgi:hypothetical protein